MECHHFFAFLGENDITWQHNTVRVKLLTVYSSVLQIGWEEGKSYSVLLPNCPLHSEYG